MANLNQSGRTNPNWKGGKSVYTCGECGVEFTAYKSEHRRGGAKFCSPECAYTSHRLWTPGRDGYIRAIVAGKDTRQHRLIAAKALGRKLRRHEIVHHINGDRADNRNSNLLICETGYHRQLHERMAQMYMKEHFKNRPLAGELAGGNPSNSGKPLSKDEAIPSQASKEEGVETVRGTSIMDEETVQTTNALAAVKTVDGMDPRLYYCGNT